MIASSGLPGTITDEGTFYAAIGDREQRNTGVRYYTDYSRAEGGAQKVRVLRGDDGLYLFYQKWENENNGWALNSQLLESYVQKIDEDGTPLGDVESISVDGFHFNYVTEK